MSQLQLLDGADWENKWFPYFFTILCFRSRLHAVGSGPNLLISQGRWMRSANAPRGARLQPRRAAGGYSHVVVVAFVIRARVAVDRRAIVVASVVAITIVAIIVAVVANAIVVVMFPSCARCSELSMTRARAKQYIYNGTLAS